MPERDPSFEIDTNYRFSNGGWNYKHNVAFNWATSVVKSTQKDNEIYSLIVSCLLLVRYKEQMLIN